MGKEAPPAAPDPVRTVNAQAQLNKEAATEQARFNRLNETTPLGGVEFRSTGNEEVPFERITSLNPTAQATFDAQQTLGLNLAGLAGRQTERVEGALGQTSDFSNLQNALPQTPGQVDLSGLQGFNPQENLNFNNLPGFQELPGIDTAARNKIEDSLFDRQATRLNQRFADEQANLDTRLANQGIQAGSDTFNRQQERFGRTQNDAFDIAQQNAIAGAAAEQSRLFGLGLGASQQAASERGQVTGERLGQFGAGITNRQQQAGERAQLGQELFGLGASDLQRAQVGATLRGQDITEQLTQRNQPINDISALLSNSQVSIPTFGSIAQVGVAAPDLIAAQQQALNQGNQVAESSNQLGNNLFALGGSIGAGALMSDRRMKKNIIKIGRLLNGLWVYLFDYIWGEPSVGVMADEVKEIHPESVTNINGIDYVDYMRII